METLTEREAIGRFLSTYAALAPVERKCRRAERVAMTTYSVAIIANVTLPAVAGFAWYDLANYALACLFALGLRRWILRAIDRRRGWLIMGIAAAHARARLAYLDRPRPERKPTA